MLYYEGNKCCLAGLILQFILLKKWAFCFSPHKFSFKFVFAAFNVLCFHFEDNGVRESWLLPTWIFFHSPYLLFSPH